MDTEGKDKKIGCLDGLIGLLGILMLVGLIIACVSKSASDEGFRIDKSFKMKNYFQVSWGSQKTQTDLPSTIDNSEAQPIYMTTILRKEELGKGNSILLRSRQSRTKIYLDDTLIYDSGKAYDDPFFMGYGSLWKSVQLGDDYDGKTLTIELQPGYKMQAVSGYLPAIYFGTQASFLMRILKDASIFLIIILFLIGLGIYDLVYGLIIFNKTRSNRIFFLGLFSIDTGVWMLIESHVLEMFLSNLQPVIYLSYFTYGLMPVLLIRFLLSYEEFKDKTYLKIICFLGVILNLVQLLLAAVDVCSQFESQWLNRGYLCLTILGLLVALYSAYRLQKGRNRRSLYSGIFILVISTILELLYFAFVNKQNSGKILMIGICLFIFKSGIELIYEIRKWRRDNMERDILKAMAYTDGMTHLGNRFAYEQEKNRLEMQEQTHVFILIADMNGLKQANDNQGHSYGDEIICKTAEILESSFRNIGKCFRIGGDEFCVLAEKADRDSFKSCIKMMEEKAAKLHNSNTDYGIAFGVAEGNAEDIDEIFREADNLMYACKRKMKGVRIKSH